ncbi:ABC transporter substrate-binding protein [Pseudoroseomonas deserti]|uniref:ABC transporter substrate-binding protein n=1 Tax=Teichococcus deserti TaxID=1817963 RepID=A0A1V2H7L6_9PROT|nr:ABC transporter substrate-binding protein [Pseudoroseomonas deserti]ONG58100.1 ABC transporter substrate-binding protein [Pseudoroseomonas deserti]
MGDDQKFLKLVGPAEAARLQTALRQGATRRDLMRLLGAAGMGAALAGSVAGAAGTAYAQTPRRGGRIRVAGTSTSTADTLDPAKQSMSTDYARCNMFYNGLTSLDGSLTPQPALAESWTTTDGKSWSFKLRSGVTFHDGKTLDAEDVVYSLARHKDPATASRARSLAMPMVEIKAAGPLEVQITLDAANADLPVVLGTFHFLIVKAGTTDFATAIGTGPYMCKEFTPGVRSIATRNPNYWKQGRPYLDEIEFVGIPDEQARVNALLSGDIQLTAGINPRSVRRITGTPGFSVFETKSGYYTDLVMRVDQAPASNPDFALAMKYMLDRQQMLTAVLRGHGVIANDQPIDPSNRFYFAGLPQRPYDLDKAKFHFRKSGIGNSALPLVCSPAAEHSVEMAMLIQESGKQAGMNIDVKRVPADGYWSNHWFKHPLGFGAINPRPSADILFTLFFKSDAAWNESGWKNEKFDQLLLAARTETDEAKRRQMYADMQVLVHEQSGIGVPLFFNLLDGHSSKLKGLGAIPLGGLMGYSFAENVWLEA